VILLQIETTLAGGMNITTFAVTSVPVTPKVTVHFYPELWFPAMKKTIQGQYR